MVLMLLYNKRIVDEEMKERPVIESMRDLIHKDYEKS